MCSSNEILSGTYGPKGLKLEISQATLQTAVEAYRPKSTRFVHFTSLRALHSIINERAIRLYTLNNANDPQEFDYLAHEFGYRKNSVLELKKGTGLLSMCLPEVLTSADYNTLNLWRFYGAHGHGCAIELEIKSEVFSDEFVLGAVQYSKIDSVKFKEANEVFEKRHNLKVDLEGIIKVASCLHKNQLFESEREIRLLKLSETAPPVQLPHSHRGGFYNDINTRGETVGYWLYPLAIRSLWKPYITLSKIQIGFQYSPSHFQDIRIHLNRSMRSWSLDNKEVPLPVIEHSSLREQYRP